MLDLRLEEHPAPTGSRDPDMLLAWLLDSLGLVRRRNEAWGDEANQRPLQRLVRDHLLAEPGVGWDAATLADDLGISGTALHHHLSRLHGCRLVASTAGEDGWRHHFLRTGSFTGALDLLRREVRGVLELRLAPLSDWRTGGGGQEETAGDADVPFRLRVREPSPSSDGVDARTALLADIGLFGDRGVKTGDEVPLARLVFDGLLEADSPLSLDEGASAWKVTRPRLKRALDRFRAAGMATRAPRLDRLTVILWDAICSQHGRRGEEWLCGKGGFRRLPADVADSVLVALGKGVFDSDACAELFHTVPAEDQMLLLNLLGGRLPYGYQLVGDSGADVASSVIGRVDRLFIRMSRVARSLETALDSAAQA